MEPYQLSLKKSSVQIFLFFYLLYFRRMPNINFMADEKYITNIYH